MPIHAREGSSNRNANPDHPPGRANRRDCSPFTGPRTRRLARLRRNYRRDRRRHRLADRDRYLGSPPPVRLLLDTHVWLWSLLEPARLRREVAALLASPDTEKWLSPVSVWETLILAGRGRLTLQPDPESWVRSQLQRAPVRQIQLDHEIAIQSRRLRTSHEDPADRFIAATARVHELTLVTADDRLLHQPDGYAVLRAA